MPTRYCFCFCLTVIKSNHLIKNRFQVCSQRVPDSPIGTCQCQSGFGYEEDGVSLPTSKVLLQQCFITYSNNNNIRNNNNKGISAFLLTHTTTIFVTIALKTFFFKTFTIISTLSVHLALRTENIATESNLHSNRIKYNKNLASFELDDLFFFELPYSITKKIPIRLLVVL